MENTCLVGAVGPLCCVYCSVVINDNDICSKVKNLMPFSDNWSTTTELRALQWCSFIGLNTISNQTGKRFLFCEKFNLVPVGVTGVAGYMKK